MSALRTALEQIKRMAETGEFGIAKVAGRALAAPVGDGGPAFPIPGLSADSDFNGMALRDAAAIQAMAAIVSNQTLIENFGGNTKEWIAGHAYSLADAMLAERAKP